MQKIKSIAITLFLGVAAVSLTISPAWTADLITFDLTADWSDSSNPNGVWSYEVNGAIAASGTRSGDTFGTPTPIWGSGFTGWSKSNGTEGFFHDWSAGDVFGHTPTPAGSIAIAWTSPDDGTVDITGGIWEGRDIGRSNVWSLTKNGVTLTGGSIASGDAFDSSNPFDFLTGSGGSSAITGISVSTGDILRLVVSQSIGVGDYVVVDFAVAFTSSAVEVTIDIKPGSDPNCFNVNGHGVIPVAILGTADFDVGDIDFDSLVFDGLVVRIRGNRRPLCSFEDVNGDFPLDLVCHFEDDPANWTGGTTTATLTGSLFDGTPIEGTDSICVVP